MPSGPNALRANSPARTTAAERPPRASWAFFCAADVDVDADEDEDNDEVEVVKGEAARRRRGAFVRSRLLRKVVTNMSFFFFNKKKEREKGVMLDDGGGDSRRGLSFGWVHGATRRSGRPYSHGDPSSLSSA